ncbi:MAG: 4-alpha-glucanotransferase [Ruminococcaceae bacterium]|nr:4-alpha-glucanotransferase [Oscillospiraceae bacterium]
MKKQKPFPRGHGILMPIFSLNSQYGIGTLGEEAKSFLDFLSRAGCNMWQLLPLGPTGYGNSPYQCFSAFAGNSYFLNPEWFLKMGWISSELLQKFKIPNTGRVDYGYLYQNRKELLGEIFSQFKKYATVNQKNELKEFKEKNDYWLKDYTVFLALKEHFNECGRGEFPRFKTKNEAALLFAEKNLKNEMERFAFLEYAFEKQWSEIKAYAKQKKILLVGDIPLYVANDSADVWANPQLFQLDDLGNPTDVAGVPPDDFSSTGQLWGNPLYKWENHALNSYAWWKARIFRQSEFFDVIRIDHFIGISNYYSIPVDAKNAINGEWKKGPREELINAFLEASNGIKFIAEDLGVVTKDVRKLIKSSGFPGMKILQFAFDGSDNPNLLHNIPKNAVVYTGTHDNHTAVGFFNSCTKNERKNARKYMNVKQNKVLAYSLIKECHKSRANTVIIPLYDYLMLDDQARINLPATTNNNWEWRVTKAPDNMLADEIRALADIYKRL